MNAGDLLRNLFRHMEWADALVWSTVLPNAALVEDKTARDLLHHLHLVQRAFLHIWRGEQTGFKGTEELRGSALAQWGRSYHAEVARFLEPLEDAQLDQIVILPWAAHIMERFGTTVRNPKLGETLLQVAAHSIHHRAQISFRIRELGAEPPLTDFIAWLWSGRPPAAWPAEAKPEDHGANLA